jgi:multidrug efflux pump subunit AcrA (membrane-fusion protein)
LKDARRVAAVSAPALLTLGALLLFGGCSTKPAADEEPKPVVEVKLGTPQRKDMAVTVAGPATIFALEQASIASRITAPIRELRARKGDTVAAGQVLAVLDNRDIVAQRAEAQAALVEAQETLDKTRSGTQPTDVEKARGQLAAADAAYQQSQKIYERRKQLFEQGAIPQRDLLQTQTDLATNKANFEVAQRSYDLLQQQSNKRDLAIAQSRLEQAQARLGQQSAQLQFSEIRSPFAGTVTDQTMYPGDMANPGTPIFTVADMSKVNARAQLAEGDAARVRAGMPCRFIPQTAGAEPIPGRITVINRAVDPQRRTIEVWCEITKPTPALRVSGFGRVLVTLSVTKNAISVPLAAVERKEGTDTGTVTVIDERKVAHKKEVRLGTIDGNDVEVKSGLTGTELLAVEGNVEAPDGATVQQAEEKNEGDKKEGDAKDEIKKDAGETTGGKKDPTGAGDKSGDGKAK